MTLVLPLTLIAYCVLCVRGLGVRDAILSGLLLFGVSVVVFTEVLGALYALRRGPLLLVWCIALLSACWRIRRVHIARQTAPLLDGLILAGIVAVFSVTLLTALASPPNSADALAYHMPRVIYWAQQASVSFFPTSYFNQISLQPLAEFFILQTYLLSGSDRFANLIAWMGSLGCAVGVSLIAGLFGAGRRGQILAALFCVTLPNGILQASGAKNDYLLALWLATMCYFAIRWSRTSDRWDALALSAALGLALFTKATAYLFAPPMLMGTLLVNRRALRVIPALAAGILLLNGPQYWRNFRFSGSPLGYDSAQGDGFFRWRNDTLGWRQTFSNALRNASEQLGARSPVWNQRIYDAVLRAHDALGIGPNDSATTWRWAEFAPPKNSNHEAVANNRWHLLLLLAAAVPFAWRRKDRLAYLISLPLAFLLFCFYLKWQPYSSRMFLPLFVLGSPIVGTALEKLRPATLQMLICLFLLNNARPYLFENWVRPWRGPNSIWKTIRDEQYFNDMGQWDNRASFEQSVAILGSSACDTVGIDISHFHVEYPFQALLRGRKPSVRFIHSDVVDGGACAVVCMECASNQSRIDRYAALGPPMQIGRFLLFVPNR